MLMESVCHLSGLLGTVPQQGLFVEKSYQEPDGSIIQPDDTVKMIRRPAVVPGAHVFEFQKSAADIFAQKNTGHIYKSPPDKRNGSHLLHERSEKRGAAIDWKHPQRGASGQLQITHAESVQAGPENFHGPADHSTPKKILYCHGGSI